MWARKRIDICWSDLALALAATVLPIRRRALAKRVEAFWAPAGDGLACLSVRSGLDLLLSALALPAGSEILMTAVTIDDMRRVVAAHGLTAVPVDLDSRDMAPDIDALQRVWSPRARAIVVAHLFGGRVDMEPVLAWARAPGLLVIEDCAQAFCGPTDRGHPTSDVAMFSFGSIKTCTALGGALLRVRDRGLLDKMRALQSTCPVSKWPGFGGECHSRAMFAARIVKYAALKFLAGPRVFSWFVVGCRQSGYDYDRLLSGWVRGFASANLLDRLRRQPSAPLLALLLHRLKTFDAVRLAQRSAKGEALIEHLRVAAPRGPAPAPLGVHAHTETHRHTHWVFPIVCDRPERMIAALVKAGFDANRGGSLVALHAPADRPELEPATAQDAIGRLVYLPCYAELPDRELARMAAIVRRAFAEPVAIAARAPRAGAAGPLPEPLPTN